MTQYEIMPSASFQLKTGEYLETFPLVNPTEYSNLKEIGFFKRVGEEPLNEPQTNTSGEIINLKLSNKVTFGDIRSSVLQMFILRCGEKLIPLGVTNFTLIPATITCDTYVQVWDHDVARNYPLNQVFGVDYLLVLGWSKFVKEKLTREMYIPIYSLHESCLKTFVANLSEDLRSRTGIFTSPRGSFTNPAEYVAFTKLAGGEFALNDNLKLNTISPYARTTIKLAKRLNMRQVENITFGGAAGPVYFGLASDTL